MNSELLLIDDDEIFNLMSLKMIEKTGFHQKPRVFKNGNFALDHLKKTYNENTPYLIFLDINMPVMNGWEFLDALDEFANPENMYVFMLTSSINERDKKKAEKNKYVLKFLTKPVSTQTFNEISQLPKIQKMVSKE